MARSGHNNDIILVCFLRNNIVLLESTQSAPASTYGPFCELGRFPDHCLWTFTALWIELSVSHYGFGLGAKSAIARDLTRNCDL